MYHMKHKKIGMIQIELTNRNFKTVQKITQIQYSLLYNNPEYINFAKFVLKIRQKI